MIFFCPLPSNLSSYELPVESLIIVVLVDIQIHFLLLHVVLLNSSIISVVVALLRAVCLAASLMLVVIVLLVMLDVLRGGE